MHTTGNTILITGGGSGIGRGLAEAFHNLGNQVVISGRNEKSLREVVAANRGMKFLTVDMTKEGSIRSFAAQVASEFPSLNVLINNAGVMRPEEVFEKPEEHLKDAEEQITTNLLGPIRLTALLLPLLQKQPSATVMTVSSGLAFVPLALNPTYCATKAAIHSYSQSLRYQLQNTSVQVIELAPPYVATHLQGADQANDPNAMPLDEFITEVMHLIETQPDAKEILVKRVRLLRFAGDPNQATYDQFFVKMNETMAKARANR